MEAIQAQTTLQPSAPTVSAARPGKNGQSVGHLAKQAVSAAREAGIDLPRNAQGVAASQIAQGADPASVFAAAAEPDVPAGTGETGAAGAGDDTQTAAASYEANADAVSAYNSDGADTALAILTSGEQET